MHVTVPAPAAYQPGGLPGVYRGVMLPGMSNLEAGFPLRCFQRLSLPNLDTRHLLLAEQPVHQRFVHLGPLVLKAAPLKSPSLITDTFCPLSDGPSTRNHQIIKTCFRTCSRCLSRSQAPLCLYTRALIPNQGEGTFAHLR